MAENNSIFELDNSQSPLGDWLHRGGTSAKTLSVKYSGCKKSPSFLYLQSITLTMEVSASNLASNSATVYLRKASPFLSFYLPVSQVINTNGRTIVNLNLQQEGPDVFQLLSGTPEFEVTVNCDGISATSARFRVQCLSSTNDESSKCPCKKQKLTADDLRNMVTQLRKQDDGHWETQYDERKNPMFQDDQGNVYRSNDRGRAPKEGLKKYRLWKTFYDAKTSGGEIVGDKIFYLHYAENVDPKQANYESLADRLDETFKTYEIKTCLQKIHFLAQLYIESDRFGATYESDASAAKSGEDFYRGRGFMQLTHKENYQNFYKSYYNKKENPAEKELKAFVPLVASDLKIALASAGWYWKDKNVGQYADKDDVGKVSAAINYPKALTTNPFSSAGIKMLDKRKLYYELIKEFFHYDECK